MGSGENQQETATSPVNPLELAEANPETTEAIGAAEVRAVEQEIERRIGMPAQLGEGVDATIDQEIAHMQESGWMIEATVEQVEAALQAARETPDPQDDRAALILAHRASCRFYVDSETSLSPASNSSR